MGPFSMILALTFAAMKACLIAGIFMNALSDARVIRVVIAGGIVWYLIFTSLTLCDYITR
ncbi:MAG: hypothetical protein M3Y07_16470 [Acidobacteriota bacterium]|nr:hypothetical protein [Acidobacteriota bacterium]